MSLQFWRRWLMVVVGGVILYSACLVVVPDTMRNVFSTIFFAAPNAVFSDEASAYIRLLQGVLGAVLIGWMLTTMIILMTAFRRGERGGWYSLAVPILLWFIIDTGFSLVIGVTAHALFNVPFLFLFAVPLAATLKESHAGD